MEANSKQLKQRRFFTVLPVLILPFLTLIFWALGGGTAATQEQPDQVGINTELPKAQLEDGTLDKMSLYKEQPDDPLQANDTAELNQWQVQDGYSGLYDLQGRTDPNEQRIRQRLNELERIISDRDQQQSLMGSGYEGNSTNALPTESTSSRLDKMMERMNQSNGTDPELENIDRMLQKIIEIQHPDAYREKLKEQSREKRGTVFPVSRLSRQNEVPYIKRSLNVVTDTTKGKRNSTISGFWGLSDKTEIQSEEISGIPAVVEETRTVVSGSELKLRLTEDIYVNGMLIPSGYLVSGTCSLEGERLQVMVTGIQYRNYQLPVSLTVYGLDGMKGVWIPGTIGRDAAKDGADRAMQSMQFMSMDPSLLAQSAGAGIEAVKGIFSKKAKLIKVIVKAGHPLLLFDEQANNQ